MANYRRLISYIYAYEGGVKGKNVGYAKIEVRGGQSKVSVNVKKVYVGSSDIGVYLLTGDREVLLGKIFIRNGGGEYRATFSAQNVDGTGLTMDQCYGLTIHDMESAWQSYTTIWEDAVAHAAEIELADVTSENRIKKEEDQRKREEQQVKAAQAIEPAPQMIPSTPVDEPAHYLDNHRQASHHQDEHYNHDNPAVQYQPQTMVLSGESLSDELAAESLAAEHTPVTEKATEPELVQLPDPQDPELLAELERQELDGFNQQEVWGQFQCTQPKLKVFDYEHGCEILSIKPQDLGLLPREVWVYGNNSFLLHGYYNHRHLILARLNNPQGNPRYLLGVPGHYYSNEKYMASMFGFTRFVLAKNQKENDERFGYWYTDVQI